MSTRTKLPATRHGVTHKITLGAVELYVTVNTDAEGRAREMFGKATEGWQGWLDVLCETASLYLQRGGTLEELARHWRGQRFPPDGIAGQGSSIPDAIARMLEERKETETKGVQSA
jgi:ribonucleoside-diphosphate reductase alpha chain